MFNRTAALVVASAVLLGQAPLASAQLATLSSFNPSNNADPCGTAVDPASGNVWAYDCFGANLVQYTAAGVFVSQLPRPGESANDCDVEVAPESLSLNGTDVPAGSVLFINGETSVAEIYGLDPSTGAVLATLTTAFGVGHVVGGAYHSSRETFFLVQDKVPGGAAANRVAEVHSNTGAVLNSFQVSAAGFVVNYGDLDVAVNGNLLLVSSDETNVAEFTPAGVLVQEHAYPAGVTSISGIAVSGCDGVGWVGGTGGVLWRLSGFPSCNIASYCTAGTSTNGCAATISASGVPSGSAGAGFTLSATSLEGAKSGLFFYGTSGALASPWGGSSSYLCVGAPTQRTVSLNSGGLAGTCGGAFTLDWNQFVAANPGVLGTPFSGGETVHTQAWYRDPPSPKTTHLSNGLSFTVNP